MGSWIWRRASAIRPATMPCLTEIGRWAASAYPCCETAWPISNAGSCTNARRAITRWRSERSSRASCWIRAPSLSPIATPATWMAPPRCFQTRSRNHERLGAPSAFAKLPHRDRKSAQVGIRHQPDLPARELENGALLVGEHDRADAADDGKACASGGVDAGNVRWTLDVAHPALQHRPRTAEHQAVVDAADRKRIAAAVEAERAMAGRAADDPAALEDDEGDTAGVGACAVKTNGKQRDQGDQGASQQ